MCGNSGFLPTFVDNTISSAFGLADQVDAALGMTDVLKPIHEFERNTSSSMRDFEKNTEQSILDLFKQHPNSPNPGGATSDAPLRTQQGTAASAYAANIAGNPQSTSLAVGPTVLNSTKPNSGTLG